MTNLNCMLNVCLVAAAIIASYVGNLDMQSFMVYFIIAEIIIFSYIALSRNNMVVEIIGCGIGAVIAYCVFNSILAASVYISLHSGLSMVYHKIESN